MKADIENRIKKYFSDTPRVKKAIDKLVIPEEEKDRVIRCVLYLSDSDYDSLGYWVQKANEDRRDVYFFAEYDNRAIRKWNFRVEFDRQFEYEFHDK